MKENLITEIRRIQEIMGTEKTVLTEQAALLKTLLKKTKGLTDDFEKLFKNASTELSDLASKGTKNTKGEIIGAPDEVLNRLYSKIDLDEVVAKLKSSVLSPLLDYENITKEKILDLLVKGEPITDEMIQGFKEVYKQQLDNKDFLDGVPAINAKLVDDFEKSIREFVSKNKPAPKRFTSEFDVKKQISDSLGVPLEKLLSIQGVSPIIDKVSREMNGKTIEQVAKQYYKVLEEIEYKPEFKEIKKRLGQNFFERAKDDIFNIIKRPERKYVWGGDVVIDPETGKPNTSIGRTSLRAIKVLYVSVFAIKLAYYYFLESRQFGDAGTRAFNDTFFSAFSSVLGLIGEFRDEQGDLTIDESKELFEPTLKKLGKKQENFVFEKISRGVVKVVDFSEENPQDYVIVKESGEVSIYPWTNDMNNLDWSDLGTESWKLIKSRVENLLN
jgi:hypothetical protein